MTCSAMPSYASYSRWRTSRPRECARVVPMNVAIAPASVVADLRDGRVDGERIRRQPEVAAGDGRDHRDLVARREALGAIDVGAVARVEETRRLVAEAEQRPDVADGRAVRELELEPPGARPLAESGEQSHVYVHAAERSRRLPRRS